MGFRAKRGVRQRLPILAGSTMIAVMQAEYELVPPAHPATGLIFLCDHASNAIPPEYGTLGLGPELATHIGHDIGAAEVTRHLAARFGAPAVLARWSRLLIDLNRGEDDPTLVMKLSDGSVIPGNRDVGPEEIAHRIRAYHAPYHAAIDGELARFRAAGQVPVLISIHSFTPRWKGAPPCCSNNSKLTPAVWWMN